VAIALLLSACGKSGQQQAAADSTRNLELAPATGAAGAPNDNPAATTATSKPAAPKPAAPRPAVPASRTLAAGTTFIAEAKDTISSRHIKAGAEFDAPIAADVKNTSGQTVIPAGSTMRVRLTEFAPAENKSQKDGKLKAIVVSLTVGSRVYTVTGTVDSVQHIVKGRGVTGGDAAKVGVGAAAGAVVGGLIGKTKGAVIGGVVGAGAGTAVAVETADRDVVILPGSKVFVTLSGPLTVED
jgi:hypothetical protein